MKRLAPLFAAIALSVSSAEVVAAELHGVKMPDSITLGAQTLALNGIGVRTKTFLGIKVYVAGLYLERRSTNPEQILSSDTARKLQIRMTHNAPRDKLIAELREGVEQNAKDFGPLKARLDTFLRAIPKLNDGQSLALTYVPGKGTTLLATGGSEVTVPGKDFADALFAAWLGRNPLDDDLKKQLLGAR